MLAAEAERCPRKGRAGRSRGQRRCGAALRITSVDSLKRGKLDAVVTSSDFWRDRRVLLTGHTGFKGTWIALWLAELGADVTGFGLPPDTTPNLFDATRAREPCEVADR